MASEDNRASFESLIEMAKGYFLERNPNRLGAEAQLEEIADYIIINGRAVDEIDEIESRAGFEVAHLGTYGGGEAGRMEWGDPVTRRGEDGGGEAEQVGKEGQWAAMGGYLPDGMPGPPDLEVEGAELGVFVSIPYDNPSSHIMRDGESLTRYLFEPASGTLRVVRVYRLQGGGGDEDRKDYSVTPQEKELLGSFLAQLRAADGDLPSVEEQIAKTLPLGENWNTARVIRLVWLGEDGKYRRWEVVSSLSWAGIAGDLRGKDYTENIRAAVEALEAMRERGDGR